MVEKTVIANLGKDWISMGHGRDHGLEPHPDERIIWSIRKSFALPYRLFKLAANHFRTLHLPESRASGLRMITCIGRVSLMRLRDSINPHWTAGTSDYCRRAWLVGRSIQDVLHL